MNINRNNYEEFFIDYHDKNLTAEQVAGLFLFLESNPDLKDEFNNFSSISIEVPEVDFPLRDAIKRDEINGQNFNWYMAADVDGDLTASEKRLLDEFVKNNPDFEADAALFRAAKLHAGSEVYPGKKSLKKPVPFLFGFNKQLNYAMAAMLLLSIIAGGYLFFTKSTIQNGHGVAELPVAEPVVPVAPADSADKEMNAVAPVIMNEEIKLDEQKIQQTATAQPENKRIGKQLNEYPVEPVKPLVASALPKSAALLPETILPEQVLAVNAAPVLQNSAEDSANSNEVYLSVWEAIRREAENNLRKAVSNENALTALDNSENKKIRIMDVVSKGVEKISGDKVSVDAAYADNGKMSGFRFAAGKFSIEKNAGQ